MVIEWPNHSEFLKGMTFLTPWLLTHWQYDSLTLNTLIFDTLTKYTYDFWAHWQKRLMTYYRVAPNIFGMIYSSNTHHKALEKKTLFGILLPKLFWPTVRENCSSDREKLEIRGWRPRICKTFEITRTIYSNSERSEQLLVTECFFNLFLEASHI